MTAVESNLRDGVSKFLNFVGNHKAQLESSSVPRIFWEVLCKKLDDKIFDAGDTFSILKYEYDGRGEYDPLYTVQVTNEVAANDPRHIYLIDHAWTYSADKARHHLSVVPGLLERMINLMGIGKENLTQEEMIDLVFNEMWRYNQSYSVSGQAARNVEARMPVWYIMDEFGSAIQHSDEPNFRTVPLIHLPEQVTYSLLFPLKSVAVGEEVTRDFVEGQCDPLLRKALLLPWQPHSFLANDFNQEEPGEDYFLEGHIRETLPNVDHVDTNPVGSDVVLKVYSEYEFVNQYLDHPQFEIVDNDTDADILWYVGHFKKYKELSEHSPWKFINQFPFENVITIKDLLCITSRRKMQDVDLSVNSNTLDMFPVWLPTTYNLKTELIQFASYYQHRSEMNVDNHWIIKPWNLARGLDTHITNNLNYLMKLYFTGPKIAQKYIENPVLFTRPSIGQVKFDIRYVILVKSVQPLEVYVYRNFFLRFANYKFEMCDFDNYEKHYTVMNYQNEASLCHVLCHEFVQEFERQYPDVLWKDVEAMIFAMLSDVFIAASSKPPPCGIAHSPQSRAVYAADIMLAWQKDGSDHLRKTMQPKLLEINFTPDCKRACEYYPDFYNDIFSLLFLNQEKEIFEKLHN